MSVHKDEAMHTTTADDAEFAALMAASSLGAPHVRALGTAIPDEARRRLHAAAEPDAVGNSGSQARTEEAPEHPAAREGDGETGQKHTVRKGARHLLLGIFTEALIGLTGTERPPVSSLRHISWAEDNSRLPTHVAAPYDTCSLESWLPPVYLRYLSPPRLHRTTLEYALEALRAGMLPRGEHTYLRCTLGTGKTAPAATALLLASSRWTHSRPTADYALSRLPVTWGSILAMGGDFVLCSSARADRGSNSGLTAGDFAYIVSGCGQRPDTATVGGADLDFCRSAKTRHKKLELPTAWWRFLVRSITRQGSWEPLQEVPRATASPDFAVENEHGGLSAACMTDLLQVVQPALWNHPCSQDLPTRHTADTRAAGAAHRIMSELACQACSPGAGGNFDHRHVNAASGTLPDVSLKEEHSVFSPPHLLVAVEQAVDLAPAHRRAIPAQPPPLPDMDAYEPRPSTLLVPAAPTGRHAHRADHPAAAGGAVHAPPRTTRSPQTPARPGADGGLLLRSRQSSGGPEHHAQLWMRLHQSEDDDGKRLPARLVHRAADRYAITAVFNAGTDEERTWVFARELLADGLYQSVGIGDVIVWPGPEEPSPAGSRRIFIRLRSPEGTALLSMARDDAVAFLDASEPSAHEEAMITPASSPSAWESALTKLICPSTGE
ncbi:hypothetical protein CUT44_08850 [Streptomyces carminius]|uniref:SsgA family sporulation/cell division regulator n=1 Tax=Streptomyces carminius TaxID=2665496 RepID=A0A2M8M1S6_9ACTN|nr:SsgA family sporulation/cell division regulator [Streptomyces carminius]PJE98147.1 hypothetical protein CUT44_08850 [Streptomyces carminius]